MSKDLFRGILVGSIASTLILMSASAVAGTGIGAVFNLGKTNKVNAPSSLAGQTHGKILQVTNSGTGGGLGVTVRSGKAPIVVNAKAGKATNLNADELDGIDSTGLVKTANLFRYSFAMTTGPATKTLHYGPITFTASCTDDGSGVTEAFFHASTTVAGAAVSGGLLDTTSTSETSASGDVTGYNSTGSFAAEGVVAAAVHTSHAACRFFGHVTNDAG